MSLEKQASQILSQKHHSRMKYYLVRNHKQVDELIEELKERNGK